MGNLFEFISSDNYKSLENPDLKIINDWFSKWSENINKNNYKTAFSLLQWVYCHEDFDLYPVELFTKNALWIQDQYGVPESKVLDCLIAGKKIIWNF